MTEADIICKELEEARAALEKKAEELAEKDSALEKQANELVEKDSVLIKQLQQELAALKEK